MIWDPVEYGLVKQVRNWPHSSFHVYVRRSIVSLDWAGGQVRLCWVGNETRSMRLAGSPHPTGLFRHTIATSTLESGDTSGEDDTKTDSRSPRKPPINKRNEIYHQMVYTTA